MCCISCLAFLIFFYTVTILRVNVFRHILLGIHYSSYLSWMYNLIYIRHWRNSSTVAMIINYLHNMCFSYLIAEWNGLDSCEKMLWLFGHRLSVCLILINSRELQNLTNNQKYLKSSSVMSKRKKNVMLVLTKISHI